MGYSTSFTGVLKFTKEPSVTLLRTLNAIFGEDAREHPEWGIPRNAPFNHVDLVVTPEMDGIKWSGAEKTYGMVEQVNFVIAAARQNWPEFGLSGELEAQGEESEDAWTLVIGPDGLAKKQPRNLPGIRVFCPDCAHRFRVDPATGKDFS